MSIGSLFRRHGKKLLKKSGKQSNSVGKARLGKIVKRARGEAKKMNQRIDIHRL